MTLKSDAKFAEKPICFFKNDKNLAKFDLILRICTLIALFRAKYMMFELKKYRRVSWKI